MLPISIPYRGATAVALLSVLLAACLLAPGKFISTLDLRKDGRFSYAYTGEIHMLALSKLAGGKGSAGEDQFEAAPCYASLDAGGTSSREPDWATLTPAQPADRVAGSASHAATAASGTERPCTRAELAEQRRQWDDGRAQRSEKRRQDTESMKMILGGIDPSDPRAAEELAQRLRRQVGWKRVVHKGNGLFDVDFAITGRLDHDFVFPTIERFPMANAFVQIALREDGTVRIDAPGFAPGPASDPARAMMQGMTAKEGQSPIPQADGRFTIRTDGVILANNTDEGPKGDPAGQSLEWAVDARTPAAPTALIKFGE
jgi:hypothetical protein